MKSEEDFIELNEKLDYIIDSYIDSIRKEFRGRWNNWKLDLAEKEKYEVIGSLLARQVSLTISIVRSSENWNHEIAPIILRAMVDIFINLAWIFEEPLERAMKFILYGLGQQKLYIEHLEENLKEQGVDPEESEHLKAHKVLLESQRYPFLTKVDVGSWSGISVRVMAEEADCMDIYRRYYFPYSFVAHSMWNYLLISNLAPCDNPLHKGHLIPFINTGVPDLESMIDVAEFLDMSFKLFDSKTGVNITFNSSFDKLMEEIRNLNEEIPGEFTIENDIQE